MLTLLTLCFVDTPAFANQRQRTIEGPVVARVLKVIDGDTILVSAEPWPQQSIEVAVRLRGIDAPEIHSKCVAERKAAQEASRVLQELALNSRNLQLAEISGDKYFGRIVADVYLEDGRNPAHVLLNKGLVTEYDGGKKRPFACNSANTY